ncbi:MAG: response regulator [Desulfovibrionaceae bacterium]|nr:response regulator [Desulfovibrionaceae bacterium]MBF0512869.1 response regulator [Desulfovibrionaceae bacterium]
MARILIAEDDPTSRIVCYKIVEKLGHIPLASPDGKHAYQTLLSDNRIDVLITDIMMPVMDGRALIMTLRGHTELIDLPVIIMSAVVGIEDISDLLRLGADLFLPKPINGADVKDYIERCLCGSRKKTGKSRPEQSRPG